MGADGRPQRNSKVRAQLRLREGDDEEAGPDEAFSLSAPRQRRGRGKRNVVVEDSSEGEDDSDNSPGDEADIRETRQIGHDYNEKNEDGGPMNREPGLCVDYEEPPDHGQGRLEDGEDDSVDDDLDIDEGRPLADTESYLPKIGSPPDGATVTKSGRVSKRPQQSPLYELSPRPRRTSAPGNSGDIPLTREERARRRSGNIGYMQDIEAPSRLSRLRKVRPISYTFEDNDEHDDEETDFRRSRGEAGSVGVDRVTRSRSGKAGAVRNGRRRLSSRRRAPRAEANDRAYDSKDHTMGAPSELRRSRRRAGSPFQLEKRHSGGLERDPDGDGDYATPGSVEESEEADPGHFVEEEGELEEDGGPEDSESEVANTHARPTRTTRTRKAQPQRTVPAKRKRGSSRAQRKENAVRDTRKSYRSRSVSLRPEDFDPEEESSTEGVASSEELEPAAKRSRPARAAASRAGDAIAGKLDYLERPMATIDAGPQKRPQRGRYNRRRNRMRPTGVDPFASDGDDTLGHGPVPAGIEPLQVDLSLSWEDIGGLDHHVRALKETVSLPLLYPEIFEKFNMEAPRGVLFYGPPGTGKTLCARALAASCGGYLDSSQNVLSDAPAISQKAPTIECSSKEEQSVPNSARKGRAAGNERSENSQGDTVMDEGTEKHCLLVSPGNSSFGKEASKRTGCGADEELGPNVLAQEHERVVSERAGEVQKRVDLKNTLRAQAIRNGGETLLGNISGAPGSEDKLLARKKSRVAFFMRNGADCLSKWVGEAERQLRMTFEAAKKHQPSIIFFDEIDGLAPVRSSRQDQIHSSIVSTLLGLMDGLDARGKVVVIGATNRVDAIDPALRRPGRFDRELIFTLPNFQARRRILGIHTSKWTPPPGPDVLENVAKMTVGYCGADLKSLCSESAIRALRRRYPQIYESREKLLINVDEVIVSTRDFLAAMKEIVPASHRSARTYARPISERLGAVLSASLANCISILGRIFPQGLDPGVKATTAIEHQNAPPLPGAKSASGVAQPVDRFSSSDDDDEHVALAAAQADICNAGKIRPSGRTPRLGKYQTHRPRLLICGRQGLGQAQLGPAILHNCEGCPVHAIDYPSLLADAGARSAEEALISAFREALRSIPSILYLPHLQLWWESASPSLRTTLIIALKDVPADLPLLVLATAESSLNEMPPELTELFGELLELSAPSPNCRKRLFAPLLEQAQAVPRLSQAAARSLRMKRKTEVLPKAPPPPPVLSTPSELNQKLQTEDRYIRLLRMEMRAFADSLLRDRRFKAFWNPVDPSAAPDYYDIIKVPMDISKIASQIDLGKYPTVLAMVSDFDIMVRNAIQYNPPNTEMGAEILRRAHGLIDIVHAWVDNLNPAVVETCNKIIAERVARRQQELDKLTSEGNGELNNVLNPEAVKNEVERINIGSESQGGQNGTLGRAVDVESTSNDANVPASHEPSANGRMTVEQEHEEAEGRAVKERSDDDVGQDIAQETIVPAKRGDVVALQRQLLDVSSGVTVDGLEGLYVRCSNVLHEHRHCMDRAAVVGMLAKTVRDAREDPAVVGNLVA